MPHDDISQRNVLVCIDAEGSDGIGVCGHFLTMVWSRSNYEWCVLVRKEVRTDCEEDFGREDELVFMSGHPVRVKLSRRCLHSIS